MNNEVILANGISDGRRRLTRLSRVLRDRSLWPVGFSWSYDLPSRCAVGMAHRLWPAVLWAVPSVSFCRDVAEALDMSNRAAIRIFWDAHRRADGTILDRSQVTPEMVADDIDAYLAGAGDAGRGEHE